LEGRVSSWSSFGNNDKADKETKKILSIIQKHQGIQEQKRFVFPNWRCFTEEWQRRLSVCGV
jgi:hypothetical protein